jgi:hypothetical protein
VAVLWAVSSRHPTIPENPPADMAVGENFERFTGTHPVLTHAGQSPLTGSPNRPGQAAYEGEMVYTPGRLGGLTNTLGGEPLSAVKTSDRIHRPRGGFTAAKALTYQLRLGVGQKGPSTLGVAQTVALATITNNPPEGTPLLQMLAGQG